MLKCVRLSSCSALLLRTVHAPVEDGPRRPQDPVQQVWHALQEGGQLMEMKRLLTGWGAVVRAGVRVRVRVVVRAVRVRVHLGRVYRVMFWYSENLCKPLMLALWFWLQPMP